ncbi:hypothetical protein D3C78_856120 [compost metagenome]
MEYIVRLALRERTDEFFHDLGNGGDGNTHFAADVDDRHALDVAVGIDAHLADASGGQQRLFLVEMQRPVSYPEDIGHVGDGDGFRGQGGGQAYIR